MDKDIGLALYRDLCQSLTFPISRDQIFNFHEKNIVPSTPTFPKAWGSKQKPHDPTLFLR
jgi:hypothetical protein